MGTLDIPYVSSFCAHTFDQSYEQENGLLSQWRGYADGGYAIVFDTKGLCNLCQAEGGRFYYSAIQFGDVVYDGDEQGFAEEFGATIEKVKEGFLRFIETGGMEVGEIYGDVISMFTRLKHRGFMEEREVRIVALPMTREIEVEYKRVDQTYVAPERPMKHILRREDGAPYIELFEIEHEDRLPIKRIIVGPQNRQEEAEQEVMKLVSGTSIEVHRSATPLSTHHT